MALGRDLGYEFNLRIWVDSTTAKAIVTRHGLGKVRHMEVKFLWAQEALRRKLFEMRKITGERNPADVLTKVMSMIEMEKIRGFFIVAETSRIHDDVGTIRSSVGQTCWTTIELRTSSEGVCCNETQTLPLRDLEEMPHLIWG